MKRLNLIGAITALGLACSMSANELPAQPAAAAAGTNMVGATPVTLTSVLVRYIYDSDGYKSYAAFIYDQNHEIIKTSYDTDYEISWYTFSQGFSYPNFINMEFNTLGRTNPTDDTILTATECNSSVSAAPAPRWGGLAEDGRCWCGVKFPASFKGTLVCVVKQLSTGLAYKFTTPVSVSSYAVSPNPAGSVVTIEKTNDPEWSACSVPENIRCNLYDGSGIVRSISGDTGSSLQMDVNDLPAGNYYLEVIENGKNVHTQVMIVTHN